MRKLCLALVFLGISNLAVAALDTQQIVLVTAKNKTTLHGQLMLLTQNKKKRWQVQLQTPVVLGKNGLSSHRKEGDNKSPTGVFALGTAFGFARKPLNNKLRYKSIKTDTQCIDDARSRYYTDIVDAHAVVKDWTSSEMMRQIPLYHYGLVVPFNVAKQKGLGSCIFMHIWKGKNTGTAGCTAMPEWAIKKLIVSLDPQKHPVLVQMVVS